MSRGKKIAIGIIGTLVILCGLFMWFVSWSNSDAGQATFKEIETKDAIESATAAVQNTQSAAVTASAAGTATAVMAGINTRIQNAKLIFEEKFDEGSPFIAANIGDRSIYFSDGAPQITFAFDGFNIWQTGAEMKDFAAEVDCGTSSDGTFCGIAYDVHADHFYASYIAAGGRCGFDDMTGSYSVTKAWTCNYAPSPAAATLNRVRVERFGQSLRFYVNGALMDERVLTNEQAQSGGTGLYIGRSGGDNTGGNYVQVDSFKVWELP